MSRITQYGPYSSVIEKFTNSIFENYVEKFEAAKNDETLSSGSDFKVRSYDKKYRYDYCDLSIE